MKAPRPRRPSGVTWLAMLVLTFAVLNLLRLVQSIQMWPFLAGILTVSPVYLLLSGLLWAMVGFPLALGLWRGWRLAYYLSPVVLLGYSLYIWADRLLLSGYPERQDNWPLVAILNLAILVWSVWILTRPRAMAFFGERHEQKPENTTAA